jgi:TolB-like protein
VASHYGFGCDCLFRQLHHAHGAHLSQTQGPAYISFRILRAGKLVLIAKQLGVAHILEGSVQKSADAMRINVQLINATNWLSQ